MISTETFGPPPLTRNVTLPPEPTSETTRAEALRPFAHDRPVVFGSFMPAAKARRLPAPAAPFAETVMRTEVALSGTTAGSDTVDLPEEATPPRCTRPTGRKRPLYAVPDP